MTTSTVTRQYRCQCGTRWQSTVRITAQTVERCRACGKACRPLVQPAEIVFRGENWPDKERKK